MIDLRSDTLTMPTQEMLESILTAKLGDDGRTDASGRGEDKTINELEDLAALMTGKEEAILFCSGTAGNTTAILTHCKLSDKVLVDRLQHIYKSEKVVFDKNIGQLEPVFYELDENHMPDIDSLEKLLSSNDIKMLCIENTHNFSGGACIDLERLEKIYNLAKKYNVHVHMDGARLFNAATFLKIDVKEICKYTDSVMFCISKGLGAPVGSLVCGTHKFMKEVRKERKLLGGTMRQAGIIAAPGIYALKHNVTRLQKDHENAQYVAGSLKNLDKIIVQTNVATNIIMLDVTQTGLTPEEFCTEAKKLGLLIRPVLENKVRLVFHLGVNRNDAIETVKIIKQLNNQLT